MEPYDETIFEAVTKIVASTTEENEEIVSADGGKQVAAYFRAVYDGLSGNHAEPALPSGGFEIVPEEDGGWKFLVVGADGNIAGTSPVYPSLTACLDRLRVMCE
ncbi:MAG TPA: hypothetical protein PKY19_02860 [Oscillospiraceae bacterium]|nr:hypothetical protein [Oscillospiraceae bacterium]HXK77406.1 hypothetical protein [Oscillospiraceae bacterium]